jgi:putative addiction module component (TIGR02574 family)
MPDFSELLSAATQLPVDERMRLIDELTDTIPDISPAGLSAEWVKEITRRSQEIDAGTAQLEDWEDVRARLYHRIHPNRED